MLLTEDGLLTTSGVVNYMKEHHLGKDNAAFNHVIAARLNMPDLGTAGRQGHPNSRELTRLFNAARAEGHPIGYQHGKGLFYATQPEDLNLIISDYMNRAQVFGRQAWYLRKAQRALEEA